MLYLNVPSNKLRSWDITLRLFRSFFSPTFFISTSSIVILPLRASISLPIDNAIVLFPLPVRPTMPTFSPGFISNDILLSRMSVSGL